MIGPVVERLRRLAARIRGLGRHFPGTAPGRRIVIFTEHYNATYYISFEIPLRRLQEQVALGFSAYSQDDVEAAGPGNWQRWLLEAPPEAVVFTRYGRADGCEILAFCRARGIPVAYHIDDDLLELPASLGSDVLRRNAGAETMGARTQLLAGCDLIYASTPVLAQVLGARFPAQRVFHGIYAPFLPVPPAPAKAAPETIGYMGSRGHAQDLALVVPALVRLMRERPGLRFETFGSIGMPAELLQFHGRVRHHDVRNSYREFLAALAALRWRVGLAPLADTPFNRCKAPTKFIEYSSCGIPTAASAVVPYVDAVPAGGGELVRDDWHGALSRLLNDPARARAQLETARAHCASAYGLDRLAAQLLHVFELLPAARAA